MSLRSLLRFKTGLRAIAGIEKQLERLADLYELQLAEQGIVSPEKLDTSGGEPFFSYTDEEKDAIREMQEKLGIKKQE